MPVKTRHLMKQVLVSCLFFWIVFVTHSLAIQLPSKDQFKPDEKVPWEISAKSLTFDQDRGVYIAEGEVVISKGDQTLYAEYALYNIRTKIAEVSGGVRFEVGRDYLEGNRGVFDLEDQTGRMENALLFLSENHFYITGEIMEKLGKATYVVKNCRVTSCDGDKPDWSISASQVNVTIEGHGTAKDAAFRVLDVPVLYTPYAVFPAKTKRQTGFLLPTFGYSSRNGVDVELPFFWAISDQTDATFYQRYMAKRGYMQGLEFRYIADEDSRGVLQFDVLSDRKNKDMNDPDDVEISPFSRNNDLRYWLRGKADQNLPYGISGRADVDYVSDQDYLQEFEKGLVGFETRSDLITELGRPLDEDRSPTRRSALRFSRDQENYSFQAGGSYYQRPEDPDNDRTPQPLAGLNFVELPQKITRFPLFVRLDSQYDYIWRDVGPDGHQVAIDPELRLPLWLGPYLEFEPSFQYALNTKRFNREGGGWEDQTLTTYQTGIRTATNIERVYDLDLWNAKKVKHRIWPTLRYTYRNYQDEDAVSPWFVPLEGLGDANEITFSLENFLDARLESENDHVSYRQWLRLTLEQGYDLDEAGRQRRDSPGKSGRSWLPISATTILNPVDGLNLRGRADWDHYDKEFNIATFSLDLSVPRGGDRKDTFDIDYQYVRNGPESLNLWVNVHLIYGFFGGTTLEREVSESEDISKSYWLGYESQCWGMKFIAEQKDRETNYMVAFKLLGLGQFGEW